MAGRYLVEQNLVNSHLRSASSMSAETSKATPELELAPQLAGKRVGLVAKMLPLI